VYTLGSAFGLKASTYPGHQEGERAEKGFAPNPNRLNRGIDWTGSVADMQRFADYLLSIRTNLEQVIWQNPNDGRKVGVAGGDNVSATAYYAQDYAGHRDHVHTRQSQPIPLPEGTVQRPDFNEYWVASRNYQNRNGTKIDLFLLHTQEGTGNADSLARWLGGPVNVSYHYTVSQDPRDNGVTVCDVVDTDYAAWSVLSANNRSINLCFAGSSVNWSREMWMRNSKALDAAAWLAVQDCKKYGIPFAVIAPPYTTGRAGISDHAYVTKVLKDGTHSDVGPNFPWLYFMGKVAEYSATKPAEPVEPPKKQYPKDFTDRQLLEDLWLKVAAMAKP
jgi:N-acetyl-anhydromuramyl-L-alanine amidase AmpD